ncbi:hypothetical protein [Desulfotomaculum nigrificans]|uniref:hypothetical protein n=1 Tax=Desulfotomaculum nigrificans TaxID=1565 RepID=UPI0001FAE51C|nr:hypothetical protein [Desulfotomaculum nigrificans]
MTDISISLDRVTSGDALQKVDQAIAQIGPEDELTISMEAADAHDADQILALLSRNNFDYQPRGSHNGKKYLITARRRSE